MWCFSDTYIMTRLGKECLYLLSEISVTWNTFMASSVSNADKRMGVREKNLSSSSCDVRSSSHLSKIRYKILEMCALILCFTVLCYFRNRAESVKSVVRSFESLKDFSKPFRSSRESLKDISRSFARDLTQTCDLMMNVKLLLKLKQQVKLKRSWEKLSSGMERRGTRVSLCSQWSQWPAAVIMTGHRSGQPLGSSRGQPPSAMCSPSASMSPSASATLPTEARQVRGDSRFSVIVKHLRW